ncbi:hypothetical protein [Alteromonas lipolytica]|uniref:Electron transfer flavoprotein subunit beta n=1 Tax=Alteromonas lipolytica TaxID=1856405 RepID=A0A1E8FAW2_9ALTE|nr:hypothetical protein [Alteromonas lipolytica]OFI32916.1 hypothetical protein BFC17_01170 [Alteromonas lipolytica]GGF64234.1 electron transfer flavoprotein subunit beta [Alteromonas lipolytica]
MTANSSKDIAITTLLSVGQHPLSARPRRAEEDARALEVMLQFAPASMKALHAGDTADAQNLTVLKDYLGMGIPSIDVIPTSADSDAAEALASYLANAGDGQPHILLTGTRSEVGESSGFLPYLLAEKLAIPFVPNICDILSIDMAAGVAEVMQSLPRGQRRKIKTQLPFVASVGMAAAIPRQSSFGAARRGVINTVSSIDTVADEAQTAWKTEPARKRPKRLKVVKAKTAAERFKAATAKVQSSGGEKIYEVDKAAEAILKLLKEEKVL